MAFSPTGPIKISEMRTEVVRLEEDKLNKDEKAATSAVADVAKKLETPRSISLSGDVTGSSNFDGSTNISISATVANNSHTHLWSNITDKPSSFTPSAHNQASNTINAMTGYVKPEAGGSIATSDTLNSAIGKLEKNLDGKLAIDGKAVSATTADTSKSCTGNSATATKLATTRTINGVGFDGTQNITITANPNAHNQASSTITAMTGYSKATTASAISASDSLNVAIGKLEKSLDGKQPSGSYAAANHNHNGVYSPVSHTHTKANITDFPTALKNPNALTISLNGTSQGAYDGSAAKSFNITAASVGAAASSHTHAYLPTSGGTISGSLTVTGNILSNGNVTAYSDRRVKENIQTIDNALDKVMMLSGVTYNLIGDDKRQAGLIAQDVQKVLPEAVIVNANGILSLDYSRVISLLVNAIKELRGELSWK